MPRGGRRPGAGAPKGNTNALKTGAHSKRVKIIIKSLLLDPEVRTVLLKIGAKAKARNVYARELAVVMAAGLRALRTGFEGRTAASR